ncbi:P-loop containing nucleoside triphosphate hydrolase protein [Rhodofomes roseus]|uniref:P-loop containing nucleoside triphosphate hydrolase protein n=1 Tax=Rhodofomes roseus TaxID=34475 RepID=A0ABQ8KB41_9APHY|nr:P-loop containing nucleoside triphosphate hydrolase protein [Rhodofomes roseus]KAH9834771.1 P-loop containing nucleoside triphosphate hydrolase protein [Rhodofomes roseus]
MSEPPLQVKRVDHVYNVQTRTWAYEDTKAQIQPQVLSGGKMADGSDAWQSYCFVVVRKIPPPNSAPGLEPTVVVSIKSPYLLAACKNVVGTVPTISWTVDPLELSIDLLISFFPRFVAYLDELQGKTDPSSEEVHILDSLRVLVDYLRENHQITISKIHNLLTHGEITYDLIYAILIPGTLLVTTDNATGEPCALQLHNYTAGPMFYMLNCTGVDALDRPPSVDLFGGVVSKQGSDMPKFGRVERTLHLTRFQGVAKIKRLSIYPIEYHTDEVKLKQALLARARRWMGLNGVQHVHYQGTAVIASATDSIMGGKIYIKYDVDSRIMIDRNEFTHRNANYDMPRAQLANGGQQAQVPRQAQVQGTGAAAGAANRRAVQKQYPLFGLTDFQTLLRQAAGNQELSDDDLMLATPVLYGFSLSDKLWLEFNVEKVRPIVWSDEPFTNLVLPGNRRDLLRSLVEAHNSDLDFDDFVQGKGQGLVISLFGPPGVGKTLSAEATSEHLRRPLYMIGGGDLGADATAVDTTLKRSAIVLIDEADVFLEQRSMRDIARNAMVAVFLRHVEYYRGILFLTTNRVKAFDPAFLSRIHVALRFRELSKEAKLKIWQAFLHKVHTGDLTDDELDNLVSREVNGRQIKNATRTAMSLAKSRGEKLGYKHLAETLDAMEGFASDFYERDSVTES